MDLKVVIQVCVNVMSLRPSNVRAWVNINHGYL